MIYFIRHGESEANLKGIFAGQKDDSILTEKGREQAMATARKIQAEGIKIDQIISSPLKRAYETAEIVAQELGFDPSKITTDNRIAEYDMGSLTGTLLKKVSSELLVTAQNAEDLNLFRNRVYSCTKELSQLPKNILLVSHAGVGRMLETIKGNKNPRLFYDIPAYPNASVNKLDWLI